MLKNLKVKYFIAYSIAFLAFGNSSVIAQCSADAGADVVICAGSNVQLDGSNSAVPSGVISYDWTPITGLSCTNCPAPVCSVGATTTYTLEITNGTGCTTTDQVTVTFVNPPTANFTINQSNDCADIPVSFTNSSVGTGLSYIWDFDNPSSGASNTANNGNPSHEFNSVGSGSETFDVNLIVTDVNGCQSTVTNQVTIDQIPGASFIDPISELKNCDGSNFNLNVFNTTVSGSNSNYQIIWDDGTADFNSTTFPGGGVTHNYTSSDIFDAEFIVTGTNGCTDTAFYTIANITNPAIGAANPGGTTGCGPLDLCFPLSNFSSNHPTTYYVIDFGDGSDLDTLAHPPPASVCHTYTESSCGLPGNSYTFSIKAINLCDSSEATVSPIRVYTGPEANFTPSPNPGCAGSPITFTNNSVEGFNSSCSNTTIFTWGFGDGSAPITVFTKTSEVHTYALPGEYEVTLSTQNSCATTEFIDTVCIEAPPIPLFTITPDTACVPFNAVVDDLSDTLQSCDVTYNWTVIFNGSNCAPTTGAWNFINGTTASDFEPEFEFVDPGEYTVRLTLTNSCGSFIYERFVLGKTAPIPAINPLGAICEGQAVSPSVIIESCYDTNLVYNWSFPAGSPVSSSDSLPGSVVYNTGGNYTISLDVSNLCGPGSATLPITVNAAPPELNPTVNSPLCVGDQANFNADVIAGVTYSWTGQNGFGSGIIDPIIANVIQVDSGWFYVSGSVGGCPGPIDSVLLQIIPPPIISVVPPSDILCAGDSVDLVASGATSYVWSPIAGLSSSTTAIIKASPDVTVTYTVTGSIGSCSSTEDVEIIVNPLPVITAGLDLDLCNQPITETLVGTPVGGIWSGAGGILPGGQFTPTITGDFEVYYTFIDANLCQNEDTVLISVVDPVQVIVGADTSLCLNSGVVNFAGAPVGGSWTGSGVDAAGNFNPIAVGSNYIYYSLGAGSCQTIDSVFVTVNALPVVSAGQDSILCIDHSPIVLIGSPVGGIWSGTAVDAGGNFDPSTAGAGAFTQTYIYEDPVTECSASSDILVTVNSLPIVEAGADITLCNQPIPSSLSGTPVGGEWSGTGITNSVTGEFTPSGTGVFKVYYQFQDVIGCLAIDSLEVTVVDPVDADAGPDNEICIDNGLYNLTGIPAGGSWSGNGVLANGDFTPSVVGVFGFEYEFGVGTCRTIDSIYVTVNELPIVNAEADFDICVDGAAVNISATPLGGFWSGTGISDPLGEFDPAISGVGLHTVYYTYLDPNTNCDNLDSLKITVNELPIVDAGNDSTICNQPFTAQFYGTPVGGVWSGAGITPAGVFTPTGIGNFNVTYTFTLGTGCENSDVRVITVVDPIQADAGADLEICIDEPSVNLTGLPAGGTWSGINVTAAGVFSPVTDGVIELVYSFGVGNCETKDTMYFTVHPLPIVNAGVDVEFCISEADENFVGSPLGGIWSGTGITDANNGLFSPGNAGPGNHEIVYTYTNPITFCLNRDTLYSEVHPLPSPTFIYNPIMCIGVVEDLTNTSLLGDTYAWSFGDGATSGLESPQHTYLTPGFFDIQLIVTSLNGCVDSITQQVEVREPPIADFSFVPDSGCAPLDVAFANNSSGVQISFNWNFGDGSTSIDENPANVVYQQGMVADSFYIITLDVTNFCGTVTDIDSVQVMPSPTSVFGPEFDIGCSPWPLEIANNSPGLPDTYSWNFGDGTTSTTSDSLLTHTFTTGTNDTTYTITLTVTNECGTSTSDHVITVLPNQVNAFFNTNITQGCEPLTVDFTQFSHGSSFFNWDLGDGNTSTVFSPSHTFTTPGTYTVSLFVNDGCSYDTTSVDITVFPSPFVDFTSTPDSVCVNEDFSFDNLSIGLASSSWTFGDGGTSLLTDPTYSYSATGTYNVTLTGEGLTNGCTSSITHHVVVGVQPQAAFTPSPIDGCAPLDVDFSNLSTDANFQSWDFGDGNTSGQFEPTHVFINDGSYVITLYVENANGCNSSVQQSVTVYPLPIADFDFTSSSTCYTPTAFNFQNQSIGAIDYQWDFGNGQTSVLNNPFNSYNAAGDYTIQLIATTVNGCKDTTFENVTIYPTPEAAFNLPTSLTCENYNLLFQSTSNFADSIVWLFGDGNSTLGDSVIHSYTDSGSYQVTIMAYGAGGCGDTLTVNQFIDVNPSPIADFEYVNIQNPDPLSGRVEFTNLSEEAISYLWDFGNGDTSTVEDPIHRFRQIGIFYTALYATNSYGCVDSIVKPVIVEYFKGLHVPNAIYPGHPDFGVSHFLPKGVGLKSYHLLIYDAWGNLLWESTAIDADGRPTEAWDGTFNGVPLQQDAYVWKITGIFTDETAWQGKEYVGEVIKKSGTVTIIR